MVVISGHPNLAIASILYNSINTTDAGMAVGISLRSLPKPDGTSFWTKAAYVHVSGKISFGSYPLDQGTCDHFAEVPTTYAGKIYTLGYKAGNNGRWKDIL